MYAAWCAINRSVCKAGSGRNTQGFLSLPSVSQGYNTNVEDGQSSALLVGRVVLPPHPRLARYTETTSMHIPNVNSSAFLIIYFHMHPQHERTLDNIGSSQSLPSSFSYLHNGWNRQNCLK